jgi:hypothetical protein
MKLAINPVGGNKRVITFTDDITFTSGFTKAEDAINYAKYIDDKRRSELKFDVTRVQGKIVNLFHWNEQNLVLEFEEDLYLRITIVDRLISVQVANNNLVQTDRNITYEKIYSKNMKVDFCPQCITKKYIGKTFTNIQIGERVAWLYFHGMPLLIFCVVHSIKESEELFLSWDESE